MRVEIADWAELQPAMISRILGGDVDCTRSTLQRAYVAACDLMKDRLNELITLEPPGDDADDAELIAACRARWIRPAEIAHRAGIPAVGKMYLAKIEAGNCPPRAGDARHAGHRAKLTAAAIELIEEHEAAVGAEIKRIKNISQKVLTLSAS
jgi:predicted transcriptional regulator